MTGNEYTEHMHVNMCYVDPFVVYSVKHTKVQLPTKSPLHGKDLAKGANCGEFQFIFGETMTRIARDKCNRLLLELHIVAVDYCEYMLGVISFLFAQPNDSVSVRNEFECLSYGWEV